MSFSIFLFAALEPTELPCFKMPLQNAMARVGQKIKLEALVSGIPRPEIAWLHNGKPFQPRDLKVSTISYDKLIERGKTGKCIDLNLYTIYSQFFRRIVKI